MEIADTLGCGLFFSPPILSFGPVIAMSLQGQPLLSVRHLAELWNVPIEAVGGFAAAGMLPISVAVSVDLHVSTVGFDASKNVVVPAGLVPVIGGDVWPAFKGEIATLTRVLGAGQEKLIIPSEDQYLNITLIDLFVQATDFQKLAELYRANTSALIGNNASLQSARHGAKRGPNFIHHWELIDVFMCQFIYEQGLPQTQGELVRYCLDRYAQQHPNPPDERHVRRRTDLLMRSIPSW